MKGKYSVFVQNNRLHCEKSLEHFKGLILFSESTSC